MTSPRKYEHDPEMLRQASERRSEEARPETALAEGPRIAEVAIPNAITLPAWFSSAQACAVLQLKARSFVLMVGAQGIDRVASRGRLASAPPQQSITGSAVPLGPGVTPSTPVAEAVRLMDDRAADHVAVVVAGAVLGIVTRDDAARALASGPPRPRHAATFPGGGAGSAARAERLAA
jgi:hypothetical protein